MIELPKKIVLASGNKGKIREFQSLFINLGIEIIPQAELNIPDAEETGLSFVENGIIKARHASARAGLPALADDSGLEVGALGGAPGIYSARYAGHGANDIANNQKLLFDLTSIKSAQRTARYYAAIIYMRHELDPTPVIAEGAWEGAILNEPRGQGGFGYDPLFYVPSHNCSAAELPAAEKNRISHRGKALQALLQKFKSTS